MPFVRKADLEELLLVGQYMSNLLYNLKQDDKLPKPHREIFERDQERWDKAKIRLHGGRNA